jgi:hypothetical protein
MTSRLTLRDDASGPSFPRLIELQARMALRSPIYRDAPKTEVYGDRFAVGGILYERPGARIEYRLRHERQKERADNLRVLRFGLMGLTLTGIFYIIGLDTPEDPDAPHRWWPGFLFVPGLVVALGAATAACRGAWRLVAASLRSTRRVVVYAKQLGGPFERRELRFETAEEAEAFAARLMGDQAA